MATLKRQKARKDYVCSKCKKPIKKGDEYYRFSLTRFNTPRVLCLACKPTRSQMTTSDFFSTLYGIEDDIAALSAEDMRDAQTAVEGITGQLVELMDVTEEKRDNIPENLQEAPVGELLQGRVEAIEEMLEEYEGIEIDIDEELSEEEKEDRKEEILQGIQDVCYNGE